MPRAGKLVITGVAVGTSEGVKKEWETRGRKGGLEPPMRKPLTEAAEKLKEREAGDEEHFQREVDEGINRTIPTK